MENQALSVGRQPDRAINLPPRPPRRLWPAKIALALFSLAVALVLAEFAVRKFDPHPRYPDFMIPDERTGWLPKPNQHARASNMFGEYDTEIRTNHEGFRDTDHPLEKQTNTVRIAFLGDSFTFAEQGEESQTFVRRSQDLTPLCLGLYRPDWVEFSHDAGSLKIECMNFGVGGYDTQQELLCYENFVRKYKPDIVVLAMYVHNDLLGNAFYLQEEGSGRPYFKLVNHELRFVPADTAKLRENESQASKRLAVRWYHQLHLYNAQKQLQWAIRQRSRRRSEAASDFASKTSPGLLWKEDLYKNYRYYAGDGTDPVVVEANELTRLLLKQLDEEVRQNGGRFFIVLLPAEENIWPERWPERVKQLPGLKNIPMDFDRPFKRVNEFMPELAKRGDILDLRPALKKAAADGPIFWPRDSHYNVHGQEAAGQAIAAWLAGKIHWGDTKPTSAGENAEKVKQKSSSPR